MNTKELKAKFKAYDEDKRRFAETHEPLVCSSCFSEIMPGDDIIVSSGYDRIFCCRMCLMEAYREYFTPKAKE